MLGNTEVVTNVDPATKPAVRIDDLSFRWLNTTPVVLALDSLTIARGERVFIEGPSGGGKSTLLRIMAGIERVYDGEARLTDGFSVGLLDQEPQLNPEKDVFGNVEEAVAGTRAMLRKFEELGERYAEVVPRVTRSVEVRVLQSFAVGFNGLVVLALPLEG